MSMNHKAAKKLALRTRGLFIKLLKGGKYLINSLMFHPNVSRISSVFAMNISLISFNVILSFHILFRVT